MKNRLVLVLCLLAAISFSACEDGCTPTETAASESKVANLESVASSGVLSARLTSGTSPIPGKTIEFWIDQAGEQKLAGEGQTGGDGVATLDLKTRPVPLATGAVARSYEARFDYDGQYCSSSDEAEFKVV